MLNGSSGAMPSSTIIRMIGVVAGLLAFPAIGPRLAAAQTKSHAAGPATAVGKLLADAGYAAIPFIWDSLRPGGVYPYLIVYGKIDTLPVDFFLDSGLMSDVVVNPSVRMPTIHSTTSGPEGESAFEQGDRGSAIVGRLSVGPVALGPLVGVMRAPMGSTAKAMLGVTTLTDRRAIFDYVTDTVYLLPTDTFSQPRQPQATRPAQSLQAALEVAGEYRIFLSLMQTAKLMPLLNSPAQSDSTRDSLAWIGKEDRWPPVDHDTLNRRLRMAGRVTVFAPTDAAFARLAPTLLAKLRSDRTRLAAVLRAHVLTSTALPTSTLRTIRGASQPTGPTLEFHPMGARLDVDRMVSWANGSVLARATIVQPDLVAANGVAHGIDQVLVPSPGPSSLAAALLNEGYIALPLERLPVHLYAIRATVNGTPVLFGLDTGAPVGLNPDPRIIDHLLLSVDSTAIVLGGSTFWIADIVPRDFSPENAIFRRNNGPPIDGLLGTTLLVKYGARVDFGTGTLYLRKSAH